MGDFERIFSLSFFFESFQKILPALPVTLMILLLSTALGWVIGLVVAVIRIRRIPVLDQLAALYISMIRGVPLMVQLFLTYYGIPILIAAFNIAIGRPNAPTVIPEPLTFAVIAFAINCGAYSSESLRAALLSVDKGQIEAAHSLGLTNTQTLRRVTIPQAVVVALPTMANGVIGNLHGTSMGFAIAVVDIMARAKLTGANAYRYFEVFVAVALIYWALCIVIERLGKYLEKKFALPGAAQTV